MDRMTSISDSNRNLAAYFNRIGYGGAAGASAAVLADVHWHHVSSIPFENLDVILGRKVDLDPAAIAAKLIGARRGGYCFEQNGLYLAMLQQLGFKAEALAARVWWGRTDPSLPPRTHMTLRVGIGDDAYLCDVGFGGMTPVSPLRWVLDLTQPTTHETYRLREMRDGPAAGETLLEAEIDGGWQRLYSFLPQPVPLPDFNLANWYVSTHPASFFTQAMIVAMPFGEGRHVLQDRKSTRRARDRSEAVRLLGDRRDLGAQLEEIFGLTLTSGDLDRLWGRLATL
ncbi:arylamine N-acetyltransferase family protein [Dongia rigui]|uniref:Arylamine N-acetyltransferase n=1 Tax=Dongia rigui TaxID=940149 RepID=A0ABU5DVW6_9PROT|nr:arylamine N-acetyltransferase [Dongia rigui]MDY0871085.1 arylamine N-acetyltransferase [Dongia rigui]